MPPQLFLNPLYKLNSSFVVTLLQCEHSRTMVKQTKTDMLSAPSTQREKLNVNISHVLSLKS